MNANTLNKIYTSFFYKFNAGREWAIVVAIVIMMMIFTFIDGMYINPENILDILDQSVINAILALGICFTIISGGIDLSIGSTLAVIIVITGKMLLLGMNPILASFIGLALGFFMGVINGFIISKMKLQPFIVTLGTMSVYRGIAYTITGGQPVLDIPSNFREMIDGKVFGIIPFPVIIIIISFMLARFILKNAKIGIYIYSIGGNEEATKLSGINTSKYKIIAYGLSGTAAALAALIMLARLGTGEPATGQGYELDAIAAAAIGGTSLLGGKGTALGVILGAVMLSGLQIGLIITGVDTFYQFIATGSIIIIASYSEHLQKKLIDILRK